VKFRAASHSDRPGPTHSTRCAASERPNLAPKLSKLLPLCLLLFFSVGSASTLVPSRLVSHYRHAAWRIQDGYFSSPVTPLAHTADGYLWIATRNGLFRFEGVRFVPWTRLAGLTVPDGIGGLLAARDGSLWIGTDHGLSHWVNSKLINLNMPPDVAGRVDSIMEDENRVIWFPTIIFPPCQFSVGACRSRTNSLTCLAMRTSASRAMSSARRTLAVLPECDFQ